MFIYKYIYIYILYTYIREPFAQPLNEPSINAHQQIDHVTCIQHVECRSIDL